MDLRRGVIATAAPAGHFSKPRPVLIVQSFIPESAETVTVAFVTSDLQRQPASRIPLEPSASNGLRVPSEVMVDVLQTIPIRNIGRIIGVLDAQTLGRVNQALRLHLGL